MSGGFFKRFGEPTERFIAGFKSGFDDFLAVLDLPKSLAISGNLAEIEADAKAAS